MKTIIILVTIILSVVSVGSAQKMHEPTKGSLERKALVDAIRTYDVARNGELEGEIFKINAIRVQGNWAFASLERTNLPDASEGTHLAFLQRSGKGWKVMWSSYNDRADEVGVDALKRLRKKHKDLLRDLATFAENGFLAG